MQNKHPVMSNHLTLTRLMVAAEIMTDMQLNRPIGTVVNPAFNEVYPNKVCSIIG